MPLSGAHSISQLSKRSRNRTALQIHNTLQDRSMRNGKQGAERTVVTRHVARPGLLRPWPYHPFDATAKYRQHTEQARNVTA